MACALRCLGMLESVQQHELGSAEAAGESIFFVRGLTERELQVAELLARGMSSREIAQGLYLSPSTVRVRASHDYSKCGVSFQAELALLYHER